jgi:hypothetical protein
MNNSWGLFAPYTVKKLSKLTRFVTQYLTENSKHWVSISCLHVKITDVRIETFQNRKCYIKTVACVSTKNSKIRVLQSVSSRPLATPMWPCHEARSLSLCVSLCLPQCLSLSIHGKLYFRPLRKVKLTCMAEINVAFISITI